jgi:hypothetical protein
MVKILDVSDCEFYHINHKPIWSTFDLFKIGEEITIGSENNPYFKYFETHRYTVPVTNSKGLIEQSPGIHFLRLVKDGVVYSPELPSIAYDIANHFVTYVREFIWEDVRKTEFLELPSRQKCIWLIPSEQGIKYWINKLNSTSEYQVLKVKTEGHIHKANEKFLLGDCEPMNETIQKARQYWMGIDAEGENGEILFEGKIKIVNIFK